MVLSVARNVFSGCPRPGVQLPETGITFRAMLSVNGKMGKRYDHDYVLPPKFRHLHQQIYKMPQLHKRSLHIVRRKRKEIKT